MITLGVLSIPHNLSGIVDRGCLFPNPARVAGDKTVKVNQRAAAVRPKHGEVVDPIPVVGPAHGPTGAIEARGLAIVNAKISELAHAGNTELSGGQHK